MRKKDKSNKILIIYFIIIILIAGINGETKVEYGENLAIPIGVGYDLKIKSDNEPVYKIPISYYLFQINENITSKVKTGESISVLETRSKRQMKLDKKFFIGLEKVFLFNEEMAKDGIDNVIELIFNSTKMNEYAHIAVCKEKSSDILAHKIEGYVSSADYIEGILKSLKFGYFFEDEFKIIDIYTRMLSEGRTVLMPYIEMCEEDIVVTGLALFKNYKMIKKLNLQEVKILNILTSKNGNGELVLIDKFNRRISASALSNRKVKVSKVKDKYKFLININLDLTIENDQFGKGISTYNNSSEKVIKMFNELVERHCKDFIRKMQDEYKIDLLELGRIAAAKYGRRTGVDWDEVVSDSEIDIKVNSKIVTTGKGNFKH